ncbi:MAG: cache domain-containing protein [Gemmatimonadales bacterium]|nr:cache domain-containing protein [Gemmatimonadales bacterium]
MNSNEYNSWFVDKRGIRSVWRATVVRTLLPGLLTLLLFVVTIFSLVLPTIKNNMVNSKREMARELTGTVLALLETYAVQVPEQLSLEEAQKRAKSRLRELRYGPQGKDYFWINDMHPRMIMHPYRTELEGSDITHFQDVEGKELFWEMVRVVEADGEGFVEYMWWWKDADRIAPKTSFVKGFGPWGWVVGTGIYTDDIKAEIASFRLRLIIASLVILGVMVLLVVFMVWQARLVEERRVKVETSLLASEQKFKGLFHGTFQFMGLLDPDGVLLEINDTALELIGTTADKVCGLSFWETAWWEQDTVGQERLQAGLAACRSEDASRFEMEITGTGARKILMDFSAKPIRDPDGDMTHIVVEGWDVTEKTVLQDQLRQSQKMEAVGQLAGGVAHDFNNILMGIMGHAELLLEETPPESSQADALHLIITASTRAGNLTRQLLSFSRKGKLQSEPQDMHSIIEDVVGLLSRSIDRRITIIKRLDAEQHMVSGDPSMLQNALLNLGFNARDAMAGDKVGGSSVCRLSLSSRNVEVGPGFDIQPNMLMGKSQKMSRLQGNCLELSISDTGCGMAPEVQKMIFEPFFTTKVSGKGTGLGLASVVGCIESHGGAISLDSEPGKGTVFRVLLPLSADEAADPKLQPEEITHGNGHILLVDDEEILRNFATTALGRMGYEVTTCSDGREAVEYFRDHHAEVDLVILDLIMLRMGGEEAFQLMREIDPQVKILISSGFSRDNIVSELISNGAMGFLSKPFKLSELSREVSMVLGARKGSEQP